MFKESLQELPFDVFKEILLPFKNVDHVLEFLDFLLQLSGTQTCCASTKQPCGNLACENPNVYPNTTGNAWNWLQIALLKFILAEEF